MKALIYGSPYATTEPELREVDRPEPGPGEVLVQVEAVALNHLDLLILDSKGDWPGVPDPMVLGTDGAGRVAAVGPGVAGWQAGDEVLFYPLLFCGECTHCLAGRQTLCESYKVLGWHANGTFAEYVVLPAHNLVKKPAYLSAGEAAALPTALSTAWNGLVTRGEIKPGQSVLIHGIGSGVSLMALQLAVALGARAVVTSSSDEKLDRARAMGAFGTINYTRDDVAKATREILGGRADVVLDGVGGATIKASLLAVAPTTGRVVLFGATSGMADVPLQYLFGKNVLPGGTGDFAEFRAALDFFAHKGLKPVISHTFAFDQFADALAVTRAQQQFGKVLLEMR
jgi:zinc-binding alcohol dehydrogenase/oxidoreductase